MSLMNRTVEYQKRDDVLNIIDKDGPMLRECELDKYQIKRGNIVKLIPKQRSGRPVVSIKQSGNLVIVTYNFSGLGLVSIGFFGIFGICMIRYGFATTVLKLGLLLIVDGLFWVQGVRSAIRLHNVFRGEDAG